jgi:hypothetical protein
MVYSMLAVFVFEIRVYYTGQVNDMTTTFPISVRRNQRILLLTLVAGALVSIMLDRTMFPVSEKPSFSASTPMKEEQSRKRSPHSAKDIWGKFTDSIKHGRTVPACSDAERTMNQC